VRTVERAHRVAPFADPSTGRTARSSDLPIRLDPEQNAVCRSSGVRERSGANASEHSETQENPYTSKSADYLLLSAIIRKTTSGD
jgi:hypothetical protein